MSDRQRIFLSSVQKEFAVERRALKDFIQCDAFLHRFFEVFLFEDVPAADRRADEVYLAEVDRCAVYVVLLGNDYGQEDAAGRSPTEREFERATEQGKERLVFVSGQDDTGQRGHKGAKGVNAKMTNNVHQLFGEKLNVIIDELLVCADSPALRAQAGKASRNETLAA